MEHQQKTFVTHCGFWQLKEWVVGGFDYESIKKNFL